MKKTESRSGSRLSYSHVIALIALLINLVWSDQCHLLIPGAIALLQYILLIPGAIALLQYISQDLLLQSGRPVKYNDIRVKSQLQRMARKGTDCINRDCSKTDK